MLRGKNEEIKPLDPPSPELVPLEIKPENKWLKWLKYVSLVVLVVQNAGQVLVMRYAKTRTHKPNDEKFLDTVAVFFNEIVKLVLSIILFTLDSKSLNATFRGIKYHFFTNWLDTVKVGVPALIYTIQNVLLYTAVANLEAATYMVTYQMKILTTAGFTVLMLKRKLSLWQWISLLVLILGVICVQYDAKREHKGENEGNPVIGLIAVLIACVLSGFAGIYFEKILKGSKVSLWMRNIQLAALSIPCCLISIALKDRQAVMDKGFMQGFDYLVWIVVLIQAAGGLVVAVVIKYADNILKAFATSIAIIVGTVASIFIFDLWPQLLFLLGAFLVIAAVVIYGMFPYRNRTARAVAVELKQQDTKSENGSKA